MDGQGEFLSPIHYLPWNKDEQKAQIQIWNDRGGWKGHEMHKDEA